MHCHTVLPCMSIIAIPVNHCYMHSNPILTSISPCMSIIAMSVNHCYALSPPYYHICCQLLLCIMYLYVDVCSQYMDVYWNSPGLFVGDI